MGSCFSARCTRYYYYFILIINILPRQGLKIVLTLSVYGLQFYSYPCVSQAIYRDLHYLSTSRRRSFSVASFTNIRSVAVLSH